MVQKAKILLVDDRPENLLALEAILSALDQTLVRASSGEEALKALLTDDFAVILLDVQMPGMDGFETAAHIKRRERTRDIPIIFLTAINHGPHHTFRGYAAGAVDYISKPFDPWVLRAKVSVFVELYMKNCQLREQAALLRLQLEGGGKVAVRRDQGARRGCSPSSPRGSRLSRNRPRRCPSSSTTTRRTRPRWPPPPISNANSRVCAGRWTRWSRAPGAAPLAAVAELSPRGGGRGRTRPRPAPVVWSEGRVSFAAPARATRTGEAVGTRVPCRLHR